MQTINEIQDEIIEDFQVFDDWMDKYQVLIDMGSSLESLPEEDKNQDNLIDGCQSRVWIAAEMKDGKMQLRADSDALIVKGLVALLLKVLNNQDPKEVANADLYFIDKIGFTEHLSPTRSNGLLSMIKQIKYYAVAFAG
ncbi:SufE family protein [Falsiporphyromonas endometrii]|uniref:SufE family protein n=1 Tax=Falsiporphyromonas endometrii TaxID=1387297 RepID=A0ABV9K6L4_9PORP|nr:SufE family protein [Porphyromonadaceae bacterium]